MQPAQFPTVIVQIPDDADTGLVRSRVQKALAEAGETNAASAYLAATDHLREDAQALVRATASWVSVSGGNVVESLLQETASGNGEAPAAAAVAGLTRPTPVLWQYKVVKNLTAARLEETLNDLGAQGWELVSMTGLDGVFSVTGNKLYAVMKRQLSSRQSSLLDPVQR